MGWLERPCYDATVIDDRMVIARIVNTLFLEWNTNSDKNFVQFNFKVRFVE